MGPEFFTENPPSVYPHDYAKLQKRAKNEGLFRKLNSIYGEIPHVQCSSCADICCRESPDVYLIEYLNMRRHIKAEIGDPEFEAQVVRRSLEWCLIRFVKEKSLCPFVMDGKCLIYEARPINCRLWALESDEYYQSKANRAMDALNKQYEFFEKNGITPVHSAQELALKKCADVKIEGDARFSEKETADLDLRVAFLHMNLIPQQAFRSMNFHLHFPGFAALAKIPPESYDAACVQASKEFLNGSKTDTLDSIISKYCGKVP